MPSLDAPAKPPLETGRNRLAAGIVVAVLVGLGVVTWWGAARVFQSQLDFERAGADCVEATFRTYEGSDGESVDAVRIGEKTRCVFTVSVENSAPVGAKITGFAIPQLDDRADDRRRGGTGLAVRMLGSESVEVLDDSDAALSPAVRVNADGSTSFDIPLRYDRKGCFDTGPVSLAVMVDISVLGRPSSVSLKDPIYVAGTKETRCPAP